VTSEEEVGEKAIQGKKFLLSSMVKTKMMRMQA